MTRPLDQLAEVLALHAEGWNKRQIALATGIPRSTIRGWLDDPDRGRGALDQGSRCGACGHARHSFDRLGADYAYLLGLYLGDGCISAHPRGVFRLRITLDLAYPGIVRECELAVASVVPGSKVGRYNRRGSGARADRFTHVDVGSYSRAWPCLFPQHGPGPKHEREIRLVDWQASLVREHPEPLLRGLIHSDGCRFINTGTNWIHPRYVFSNTSTDILQIFESTCELIGAHTTRAPRAVYVSRKADVALLDTFIGPKA